MTKESTSDVNRQAPTHRALIVVDVQNDFCPGGSLGVDGGDDVARGITELLSADGHGGGAYDLVVATMDWHPAPTASAPFPHFSHHPDYDTTWPVHCVQGSEGAKLHPALVLPDDAVIVRKGQSAAAYSGFEGVTAVDDSPDRGPSDDRSPSDDADSGHDAATLEEVLRARGITSTDVVGLATDYCVRATALDARVAGFAVCVLSPLVAGVAEETTVRAVAEMRAAGVTIA